jgi:TolA-binding protein
MSEMSDLLEIGFKVAEIGSILVGGIMLIRKLGHDSAKLEGKLDSQSARVEDTLRQQNVVVGELKDDIKALNKVVTEVAVQTQRLDQMAERMNRQDRMIDELRHGMGFVRGLKGVDKEYP